MEAPFDFLLSALSYEMYVRQERREDDEKISSFTVHVKFFCLCRLPVVDAAADRYKPFVLASTSQGDFDGQVLKTKASLESAGFTVLGEFTPYKDTFVENTRVIVVTSDELISVAGQTKYGGFAAPWRVAVTQVDW